MDCIEDISFGGQGLLPLYLFRAANEQVSGDGKACLKTEIKADPSGASLRSIVVKSKSESCSKSRNVLIIKLLVAIHVQHNFGVGIWIHRQVHGANKQCHGKR